MPAGAEPDRVADADILGIESVSLYGFQNLPPMTSTISMFYDWNRSSTVPMRCSLAGVIMLGFSVCDEAEYKTPARTAKLAPTPIPKYLFCPFRICRFAPFFSLYRLQWVATPKPL